MVNFPAIPTIECFSAPKNS